MELYFIRIQENARKKSILGSLINDYKSPYQRRPNR